MTQPPATPTRGQAVRPTLRTLEGAEFSRILGVGDHRPERIIRNDELTDYIDSSDEWIQERSGIRQRRQAAPDETVVDMGLAAARAAVENAGLTPADIDAVICATLSHPLSTPAAAPMIADALGTKHAAAYDLSAACSGYCYGIATADDLVRSGRARHVVVIGVEKMSDLRDTADRGTAFIFGDGAGAAVVGPSDTPAISATTWGSDGSGAEMIRQSVSWSDAQRRYAADSTGMPHDERLPVPSGQADAHWPYIVMQGPSVFRWAVTEVVAICRQTIEAAGVTAEDIDVFIPHQANTRIVDTMVKKLGFRPDVVVADDIYDMANTSGASIPLATAALLRDGRAKTGDLALQVGFGAGLAWAGQVVVLP